LSVTLWTAILLLFPAITTTVLPGTIDMLRVVLGFPDGIFVVDAAEPNEMDIYHPTTVVPMKPSTPSSEAMDLRELNAPMLLVSKRGPVGESMMKRLQRYVKLSKRIEVG